MSGNRTSVTVDRYTAKEVQLSCGCKLLFRVSPPGNGETIICLAHGTVKVTRRVKGADTSERSGSDAA
jgi:hypothetical protein